MAGTSMSWRLLKYDASGCCSRRVVDRPKEVSRACEPGWTACNLDATLLSVFHVKVAICAVAELLGNTPAVCRKCYVHPAIVEAYLSGSQIAALGSAAKPPAKMKLRAAERALLKFLHARGSLNSKS